MPGTISRSDVSDLEFVDAQELLSDGTNCYKASVSVTSVVGSSKTVTVSGGLEYGDDPVRPKDIITISGNAAAGTYTVASVLSDTQLTVTESIVDAVGGTATFQYPPGASSVGVNPSQLTYSIKNTLQGVLEDISLSIHSDNGRLIFKTDGGLVYNSSGNVLEKGAT